MPKAQQPSSPKSNIWKKQERLVFYSETDGNTFDCQNPMQIKVRCIQHCPTQHKCSRHYEVKENNRNNDQPGRTPYHDRPFVLCHVALERNSFFVHHTSVILDPSCATGSRLRRASKFELQLLRSSRRLRARTVKLSVPLDTGRQSRGSTTRRCGTRWHCRTVLRWTGAWFGSTSWTGPRGTGRTGFAGAIVAARRRCRELRGPWLRFQLCLGWKVRFVNGSGA